MSHSASFQSGWGWVLPGSDLARMDVLITAFVRSKFANMDFLVREGRECIDGDMYMLRFGSCGCLTDLVCPPLTETFRLALQTNCV